MPSRADIDFLLGITRPSRPEPRPKKGPRLAKRKGMILPSRRYFALKPEVFDIDMMKTEALGSDFCKCGRRKSGEACCSTCWNEELHE